jgi:putative tricarboxylic transport membrane protein
MFDVGTLVVFSLVGYLMKRFRWPSSPMIVGILLGALLEQSIRQSFAMSGGALWIFGARPIALGLLTLTVALPILSIALARQVKR